MPSERELTIQLGVSRTSIREALRALEMAGYIESKVGISGGSFVKEVSAERIIEPFALALYQHKNFVLDTLEVREILEVKISEMAARRRTAADMKRIADSLSIMQSDLERGGIGIEGDSQFHYSVAQATHNQVLIKLIKMWTQLSFEARRDTLERPHDAVKALAEHRKIAAAIEAGDAKGAASLMHHHITKAIKAVSNQGHRDGS